MPERDVVDWPYAVLVIYPDGEDKVLRFASLEAASEMVALVKREAAAYKRTIEAKVYRVWAQEVQE